MRVLRAADRAARPWKNGGGVTREVAVAPEGAGLSDFDWRVSLAEVREAGPFSRFDGIDRTLMILQGRLRLVFTDRAVKLDADSAPLAFPGEAPCEGYPMDGAVLDLNVMTRRGRCSAEVRRFTHERVETPALILATAQTLARCDGREAKLERFDALRTAAPLELDGAGFLIRIDGVEA